MHTQAKNNGNLLYPLYTASTGIECARATAVYVINSVELDLDATMMGCSPEPKC